MKLLLNNNSIHYNNQIFTSFVGWTSVQDVFFEKLGYRIDDDQESDN